MAKKQARPGRTLVLFVLGLAVLYGLVGLADVTGDKAEGESSWKPALGLDLQGGTRITLDSLSNPSADNLEEARKIIDARVNGSGVAEAEVVTQNNNIVVEIPGATNRDLIETVERTAQLRFRLVACPNQIGSCASSVTAGQGVSTGEEVPTDPTATGDPAQPSATGVPVEPSTSAAPDASSAPADPTESSSAANRVAPGFGRTTTPTDTPTDTATDGATATGTPSAPATDATPSAPATPDATETPAPAVEFDNNAVVSVDDAVAFIRDGFSQDADCGPTGYAQVTCEQLYNTYSCNPDGTIVKADTTSPLPDQPVDDPTKPLVACSPEQPYVSDTNPGNPATLYLLSPALIQGTDLSDASFGIPQGQVNYAVTLDLRDPGKTAFADVSARLTKGQNGENFAMVLDGTVLSAPYFESVIADGRAQISGNFTEAESQSLANSLKYGSLPIQFEANTETIGPSLAGDQLSAGLTAGAFGLGLVLIYCLFYYRGLGIVVVASLLAAAAVTYSLVLLLSETAGFVLTLPGIAGLIIAVGVTADSFIIFFERIRDEMREGKSMRVAVESGWKRAKVTRLAAQVVSLLSAAVLYIFATGAVKGFGFALGLTTLVDLAILFWFTKPMVSWLARFTFFNSGSKFSGLSPETLGIDGPAKPAGGTI